MRGARASYGFFERRPCSCDGGVAVAVEAWGGAVCERAEGDDDAGNAKTEAQEWGSWVVMSEASCAGAGRVSGGRKGRGVEWSRAARAAQNVRAEEIPKSLAPGRARAGGDGDGAKSAPCLVPRGGARRRVQPDMANLVKPVGQHMLDEASQQLHRGETYGVGPSGTQGHRRVRHDKQSAVGEPDAMGVPAEVSEDVLGLSKGRLGVDVPGELRDPVHQERERSGVVEGCDVSEAPPGIGLRELGHHLGAEHGPHRADREEETATDGTPRGPVEGESSARDDRVDVWVEAQVARPGVQDERGAEGGGETALCELQERPLGRGEEGLEHDARSEASEGAKLLGQREDDMKVPRVEEMLPTLLDPLFLRERLTLRTVPVATRVVRGVLVATRVALVEMSAEGRRAALGDVGEHSLLRTRERRLDRGPVSSNDVRQVEAPGGCRASHRA